MTEQEHLITPQSASQNPEFDKSLSPEEEQNRGYVYIFLNRHGEPSSYEVTGASLSPEGFRQASEHADRLFGAVVYDEVPPIHDQESIPKPGFQIVSPLSKQLLLGLRHASEREKEIVPTDEEFSLEEAMELQKRGINTLILRYGSDRQRCIETDAATIDYFSTRMQSENSDLWERTFIAPYVRDPRLSSANTLDVLSHIGIENKYDLVTAWLYMNLINELSPSLREQFYTKLHGRSPADVLKDIYDFYKEKSEKYASLVNAGMNIFFVATSHETHILADMDPYQPVGFASSKIISIHPDKKDVSFQELISPYFNK